MSIDPFQNMKNQLRSEKNNNIKPSKYVPPIEEQEVLFGGNNIEEISNNYNSDNNLVNINNEKTNQSIQSNQLLLDYIFTPKNDISVYDLARLLSFLKMSISQDVYDAIPAELKKHFTKCIDN